MIVRKEGLINEIIYDNTIYHDGKYRIYLTIMDLKNLLQEIIRSKSTTSYIRITPFYNNAKLNKQMNFEEFLFYLECRDMVDNESFEKYIGFCSGKDYAEMSDEEVRVGKILFPLCEIDDVDKYKELLEVYIGFLNELIPKMFDMAKERLNLKSEDIAFGYFTFEVHSN